MLAANRRPTDYSAEITSSSNGRQRIVAYLVGQRMRKKTSWICAGRNDAPDDRTAVEALIELSGVDVPVASAILTAIYPDRYTIMISGA